jgi:hypothetical protein
MAGSTIRAGALAGAGDHPSESACNEAGKANAEMARQMRNSAHLRVLDRRVGDRRHLIR